MIHSSCHYVKNIMFFIINYGDSHCLLQDLVYKGIVKVTYDRGYALQTKSLLLENTTTAADAVVQLFDALGLRGKPTDYALEEHNIMTGGETRSMMQKVPDSQLHCNS